jgi:parallel beta-helix repeat protein
MQKINLEIIGRNSLSVRIKIIVIFLLVNSRLLAANYHVAKNGSDNNSGSQSSPWLTIQHGADIAAAGDVITVESGIYNERIATKCSGTSTAKIIFISSPRRTATVRGFNLTHDFIRIEGFQVTSDLSEVPEEGINNKGTDNEIVDNFLYNVRKIAINSSGDRAYIADNRIYKSQMGIVAAGKNWIVEKNEIERMFMYGTMDDADYSRFFGDGGISRKNFYHGTSRAEKKAAHLDCFQTYDNGGPTATNITIEDNICMDCDQGIMGEGIYFHKSTNLLVRKNIFAHTWAWGVDIVDMDNVQVINNTFYDIRTYGTGIRGPYGTNGVIKNNIFMNIGSNAYKTNGGSNKGDYNLIFNCGAPDFAGEHDIVNVRDPLFINAAINDFHLKKGSPAIDAGDPASFVPDCGGKRIDIGAFEKCNDK